MNKKGFSAEILCLFFIVSLTILFGKILIDVKNIISVKVNQLIPQPVENIEYEAYSYRIDTVYEDFKEMTIIRSVDELKKFKEDIVDDDIDIDWLDEKLEKYDNEKFEDKTIVILAIVNGNNITVTRVNSVTKKNNDVTIGLSRTYKSKTVTSKYTWLSVLEINNTDGQILLNTY